MLKISGGATPEDPCCSILVVSGIDQCLESGSDMGIPGDCKCQVTQVNTHDCSQQIRCTGVEADVAGQDKLNVNACSLSKSQTLLVAPAKVKVEYFDNLLVSLGNGINGLAAADVSVPIAQNEIPGDFIDDDLDHIALKERLRMLLSRCHFYF